MDDATTARSPSHTVLELRGELDALQLGTFDLSLFGTVSNLTDRRYVGSVVVNQGGIRYYGPGPKRACQMGARIGWTRR